ncbi:hypothetical protein NQ317_014892 [Molorchus minor]|uniref:Anaphase-promoting complex subunit 13 n=1 Tax=Molorchus minor TaxID=1323400 RepID=A0ABQ9JE07_9CUCU|nr:hypothetical protein NQ317_014892 [Molorchus minor]
MDSQVAIDGFFVDLVDDAWRSDTLPEDDITVPVWELADPEADSGDIHLTLKEQEQKWTDILLTKHFRTHLQICEVSKYISEEELTKIQNVFVCSHADCSERSIVPLICERCQKHYCVRHRHLTQCVEKDPDALAAEKEKYAAPIRQFQEAKAVVDMQAS